MKKFFLILAAVAMLLPGCKKIEESIDALENRIDKLEQETIPTIDEQIAAINLSLDALDAMDKELKGYIDGLTATANDLQEQINATNTKIDAVKAELQGEISDAKAAVLAELEALETELKNELAQINATIETLKAKDAELDQKIADLKSYVDTELGKTTDWVNATFATLEQFYALSDNVAALKTLVDANKAESAANLANAISNLETSLKKWVGEQLSNYYTIAEIDAKILALQTAITNGDAALQQQLNDLKSQLESAKQEITEAYKKAIKEAIETNNGVIEGKIAEAVAAVNQRIDSEVETINAKISAIEARLDNVEAQVKDLLARIQSVSYIPEYADGKVVVTRMGSTSSGELSFRISPKDAVVELEKVWSEALSCEAYYPKTRAVSLVKLAVTEYVADAESGVISVKISGEGLSEEFFAGTQEAKVALVISDGNNQVVSDYADAVGKEITDEIWYTTTDNQPLTPNNVGVDIFGANIVSNSYNDESGWFVLKFDAPVTKIGEYAFGVKKAQRDEVDSTLKDIILPNSVTSIESWAFAWCCDNLTSISIPKSVASIGQTVFGQCKSLETIDLKNITTIGNYIFYDCSGLKSVNLSTALTTIPLQAFYGCSSLTSIAIPASVTSIGDSAFYDCTSLTSVTIPDSVTSIGERAFRWCEALESIEIPAGVEVLSPQIFARCNKLKDVILNEGLKTISYQCFTLCKSLDTITIPNSVEIIESGVFDYAIVQKFAGKFTTEDGICLIVDGVLKKVADTIPEYYTLPSIITTLGKSCFSSITPVKNTHITIPDSVTEFEVRAFGQTYNIAGFYGKYATEDHVAVIKDNILYGVAGRALPDKYFVPEGVVKIAEYAFDTVKYVSEIVLPSTIVEIETYTLKVGETGRILTALYCKALVPPVIGEKIFNDLEPEKYPTIYVPMQSRDAYLAADGWKEFADKIVGYNF